MKEYAKLALIVVVALIVTSYVVSVAVAWLAHAVGAQ